MRPKTAQFVPEEESWRSSAPNKPQHVIDTCETLQQALSGCDVHLECLWEEPDGPDENVVFTQLRTRTVTWRKPHLRLLELQGGLGISTTAGRHRRSTHLTRLKTVDETSDLRCCSLVGRSFV